MVRIRNPATADSNRPGVLDLCEVIKDGACEWDPPRLYALSNEPALHLKRRIEDVADFRATQIPQDSIGFSKATRCVE